MRLEAADRELMADFAGLRLPKQHFDHREHVHLAWSLLASLPLLTAMRRYRSQLQGFAAHHGASAIYNETITCFYLLLIRERMDALGSDHDWRAFQSANPDLLGHPKPFMERWYPGGAAFTPEAKQGFRLPA